MTKQYRQKSQVVQELLEILSNGEIGKREITLKINLTHPILSAYLEILILKGFVSVKMVKDRRGQKRDKYRITPKGFEVVKLLRNFNDRFGWISLI